MRMIVEQLVEWNLAGETEVIGENLPQRHFVHHKSHMTRPGLEPRAAAVGSQRLIAWAMARPTPCTKLCWKIFPAKRNTTLFHFYCHLLLLRGSLLTYITTKCRHWLFVYYIRVFHPLWRESSRAYCTSRFLPFREHNSFSITMMCQGKRLVLFWKQNEFYK
jgi:hypothetical protein